MSKLYTEEQVIAGIKLFRGVTEESAKKVVELLTPIELPTDEEIWKEYNSKGENLGSNFAFARGAEWMRDKIKGGGE